MPLTATEIVQITDDFFYSPLKKPQVLSGLLAYFRDDIDDEIADQKLILAPHERSAEALYSIVETIQIFAAPDGFAYPADWKRPFEDTFLYVFRRNLRKLKPRKDHVCIEGLAIEDQKPNPEEQYIIKEQVELIKGFLAERYLPEIVDQFLRRYADGERLETIAQDYGVSTSTLNERMTKVKSKLSKYMKRINNG